MAQSFFDTASATWVARAPGRVNIIGEHVDYNDGWVLPMAIEQCVTMWAMPAEGHTATFTSALSDEVVTLNLTAPGPQSTPAWGYYVQGVVWEFVRETGVTLPGFVAHVESTVPQGSGLSSSAALEVATATLLEKIAGVSLVPMAKARLCQRVEHDYVGMPCGLMDQAASTLCRADHLLLLDCMTNDVRHVPFGDEGVVVLIANTGVTHALVDSEYALRRQQCEDALRTLGVASFRGLELSALDKLAGVFLQRARHVINENARTLATVAALEVGDWATVGECLYGSHASLSGDYEVSCTELDCLVGAARSWPIGGDVIGARMTGGGFGGCTITLLREGARAAVERHLATEFCDQFGRVPAFWIARPAQGAT